MVSENIGKYLKIALFSLSLIVAIYWIVQVLREHLLFQKIIQLAVIIAGVADAYKYMRLRQKIMRTKSSRDVSRMFALIAIICDIIFVAYTLIIRDPFLVFVRGIALYTTIDLYYFIYLFYPFKTRGLPNFKRPSLWTFFVNTLQPNGIRKRL